MRTTVAERYLRAVEFAHAVGEPCTLNAAESQGSSLGAGRPQGNSRAASCVEPEEMPEEMKEARGRAPLACRPAVHVLTESTERGIEEVNPGSRRGGCKVQRSFLKMRV